MEQTGTDRGWPASGHPRGGDQERRRLVDAFGGAGLEIGQTLVGLGLGDLAGGDFLGDVLGPVVDDGIDHVVDVDALVGRDLGEALAGFACGVEFVGRQSEHLGDGFVVAAAPGSAPPPAPAFAMGWCIGRCVGRRVGRVVDLGDETPAGRHRVRRSRPWSRPGWGPGCRRRWRRGCRRPWRRRSNRSTAVWWRASCSWWWFLRVWFGPPVSAAGRRW